MSFFKENPLVTIAIPAYKREYLYNAIESVLNQSYSNLELIIVDDHSPENLKDIVSSFKDERIKYYVNQNNIGKFNPVNNWNKCLSYARGEFFALLCDDDVYEPNFIEEMLYLAYKYPFINVFRARAEIIDGNGYVLDYYPSSPELETCFDYVWHVVHQLRRQTISEFMYRLKRVKYCNGYYPFPYAWYSDYFSVFRFSLDEGISSTSKILVKFRMSGINITSLGGYKLYALLEAINDFEREMKKFIDVNFHDKEKYLSAALKRRIYEDKMGLLYETSWKLFFRSFLLRKKYAIVLKMLFRVLFMRISKVVKSSFL